jgi:small acid-soluble spore protein A (major alpha-type SASP)
MMNTNLTIQQPKAEIITRKAVNPLVVPNVESALNAMKMEIAQEMGIVLGADTTARDNGRVGGELTKRLVALAKAQLANEYENNRTIH